MAHDADDVPRRGGQLREPPAAHARVELEVHASRPPGSGRPPRRARGGRRAPRRSRASDTGPITTMRALRSAARRWSASGKRRHAERGRARFERRLRDVDGAMAVSLRLHDRPKLGTRRRRAAASPRSCRIAPRSRVKHDRSTGPFSAIATCAVRLRAPPAGFRADRSRPFPPGGDELCGASVRNRCRGRGRLRVETLGEECGDVTPVRTSPVPAVASAAVPWSQTVTEPPGDATSVSAPFRSTIAPNASAAVRAASSRCSPTHSESRPRRRASSPACGVRTVGRAPRHRLEIEESVGVDDRGQVEPVEQRPHELPALRRPCRAPGRARAPSPAPPLRRSFRRRRPPTSRPSRARVRSPRPWRATSSGTASVT